MTAYAEAHPVITGWAAVAALVLAVAAIAVAWRHRYRLLFATAVVISLGLTVDGMYHLATGRMNLDGPESLLPAVFYEAVGLYLAHKAVERLRGPHQSMGAYGPTVITLGVVAAFLAASGGGNLPTSLARWCAPVAVVAMWWVDAHGGGPARSAVTFLWSPRRLAIWLRIIAPGEHDEITIDRTRRVRALTRVGHRAADGPKALRGYYRLRLAALARVSDESMLAEAAGQVALGREALRYMLGVPGREAPGEAGREAVRDAGGEAAADAPAEAGGEAFAGAPREAVADAFGEASEEAAGDASDEAQREAMAAALTSENAKRIAKLRERVPTITQAEAIKRLKLSRATVQRYWGHAAPTGKTTTVNGKRI